MRLLHDDPARLSERRDQTNLVERIAAQALRDLAPPAHLSPSALARIAATVDTHGAPDRQRARLAWALTATAFLLGLATAASAAHLDMVPAWLSRLVQPKPRLVSYPHPSPTVSSSVSKARPNLAGAPPLSSGPSWVPLSDPSAVAPVAAPPVQVALAQKPAEPAPNPVARGTAFALPSAKREGDGDGERVLGRLPSKPRQEDMLGGHGVAEPKPPALATLEDPRPQPSPVAIETPAFAASPTAEPSIVSQTPAPSPPAVAAPPPSPKGPSFQSVPNQTAKHLKEVVQALRVAHSPKNALALLDRYRTELDGSAFRTEELLLRVEALLSLGERGEVLRLLDGTSLPDVASSQALLVTRGELRTASNRCSEGIGDFDLVIAANRRPPKQALLGRASCRGKLGDHVGAQADLDRARREYPVK
jgi:hypothetical protein